MPRHRSERLQRVEVMAFGLALLLGGIPIGRSAAQVPGQADNGQPVQIQADSGIEWQQDQHLYIARGNAVATRGAGEVHADTLIAHYREAKNGNTGGNSEIYRVDAEGHVTIKRDAQTAVGDNAVYDVDQGILVVTGKGLKLTTATDTVTARDALEWYDQKQIAVARGNAVAIRNGKTIKGDILTSYMVKTAPQQAKPGAPAGRPPSAPPGKPAVTPAAAPAGAATEESKISRIDAQGHVVVMNATDTGHGDFGVYNADSGIATLIGNVVIVRAKDVIKGQYAVMDLNKNVSRMLPASSTPGSPQQRVEGLFVRQDQGGAAGAESKPGATATPEKKP
ncbi:MAG TPA: LptA/OstA family protein [Stellaceae bacterium]|jgi:lipopolysaccharide export system protein LptA|nr:LptA/OstA family protein [Stellaceae bacterium]